MNLYSGGPRMTDQDTIRVIRRLIETDDFGLDGLFWNIADDGSIQIMVNANDLFFWACSDAEKITVENIEELVKSKADCEAAKQYTGHSWGESLFACRMRNMRPQHPQYKNIPDELKPLFDAAGPYRGPQDGDSIWTGVDDPPNEMASVHD
jgi:hypothetical protein